jgi:hydroxymethylpyrimidine pyrophosphatase-like HAD family hydrolase
MDCRMNAYPIFEEGNQLAPSIIFIDIDGDSVQGSDKILKQTLKTIKLKLNGGVPTILWTGNGYHVYVVLDA